MTPSPDFAGAFLGGLIAGVVGLVTQPLVLVTVILVIGSSLIFRRLR